ncbi:MAG: hypothetical protein JWQ19_3905 [Subtercola sp.]|nr:hypothetical protein [Subtercola sp.]
MSLEDFSAQEHEKLLEAEGKYGIAWINAYDATLLLSNLVEIPVVTCDLFFRFFSQVKKYHTLSIVSSVRLHRVQAKLDLRYFLESTANVVFSMAHPDTTNYLDIENQQFGDPKRATSKAYKWLEAQFPGHSNFMRDLKASINEETAHAHIANSGNNFEVTDEPDTQIVTSFFDFEDDEQVTVDLWLAAKAGLEAVDLILAARQTYGLFLPSRDSDRLSQLKADNDAVLDALRAARNPAPT